MFFADFSYNVDSHSLALSLFFLSSAKLISIPDPEYVDMSF